MLRPVGLTIVFTTVCHVSLAAAQAAPSIAQFLSPAFPSDLVAARKADRIAWIAYDEGKRNVYTAAAPDFKAARVSRFLDDDGIVLSQLEISDDGSVVVFQRGGEPNRQGWIADPTSDPRGAERAIWAARTAGGGGEAVRLGEGGAPALSPDGRWVAFVKDGQIYRYSTARPAAPGDTNQRPLIKEWGRQSGPVWSPDGSKLAFVSARENHSFVGVYDLKARKVTWVSPSVDFDTSPTWSADGTRLAFIRRPGTPFGQQAQAGVGGIGGPSGPATGRGARQAGSERGAGRGSAPDDANAKVDGLYRAAFRGGYTISLMVATLGADTATEAWHNAPGDRAFANIVAIRWASDHLLFQQEPEEWIRYYSVSVNGGTTTPIELTPGDGQLETLGLSTDGKTLFYATNVGDIDRRHVWSVSTAGGSAIQLTKSDEIEMYPAPLASGKRIAVLTSAATRPLSVALIRPDGSDEKFIFPTLTKTFPSAAQVAPQPVVLKADDGVEFHSQLFLPKNLKPGEHRPAMVFVHGGPIRQMLLGYHYMDFYHTAYAVNEWLASQGYIVMSVNYRSGIGYGKSFRTAPHTGGRGNAEYRDVLAAGKYLQTRPDVDPSRIGIWGLSYGGVLTAQALARNSDIFAAGIDMAGVHLWGSSLDPNDVSYQSSSISSIDAWKSPVLIWQNDDDRNVDFSQTIGLVDLLRARGVPFELIVNPDDTHETLLHRRWLYLFGRMQAFLQRNLWNKAGISTSSDR